MSDETNYSRRQFVKSTALAGTLIAGSTISACTPGSPKKPVRTEEFPVFKGEGYETNEGIAGLLFSQIGYETDLPVRIILRLPNKKNLPENSICRLINVAGGNRKETKCTYWGEIWKSHWWIAEYTDLNDPGEWDIEVESGGKYLFRGFSLKVAKDILWKETVEYASVDMLERRFHFTKLKAGWQDAGTLWVESPAQSAMIIALAELLEKKPERFDKAFKDRIYKQICVGCDYLVLTQSKAKELGFADGAMSHDLFGHEKDILPNDAVKAVIALAKAVRLLPDEYSERKKKYRVVSELTYHWLIKTAKPLGDLGLSRFQRGLPEGIKIPRNEWQTRDLFSQCWASLEILKNSNLNTKDAVVGFAKQIMERQIPKEKAESGFYGHFIEYPGMAHSEKSWIHGIVNNQFGVDIGGIYPNYLMPLIEMLALWPDHNDAPKWKETLHNFTYGYLIPACEKNPFLLVPQGIFGEEGPVWFCGTFHGTNTIYGYTAALALELSVLFDEPKLKLIAYGNLQWIAGLNAGITKKTLEACVIFSTDIPEGVALPASMMCGVGNRWAGTWFQTRGVICNGFHTGKQFVYNVEPKKANDGPFSLTDEDWIPHSAAWLTGLVRL